MKNINEMTDLQVLKELKRIELRKKAPIRGTYIKTLKQEIFEDINPTTELIYVDGVYVPIVQPEPQTDNAVSNTMINKLLKSVKNPRQKQILEQYIKQQKQIEEKRESNKPLLIKEYKPSKLQEVKPIEGQLALDIKPYGNIKVEETVEELKERMTADRKKLQYLTTGIKKEKPKEQPKPKSEEFILEQIVPNKPVLKVSDSDEEEDIIINPNMGHEELPDLPESKPKKTITKEHQEKLQRAKQLKKEEKEKADRERKLKASKKEEIEEIDTETKKIIIPLDSKINTDTLKAFDHIKYLEQQIPQYTKKDSAKLENYLKDNDVYGLLKYMVTEPQYKKTFDKLSELVYMAKTKTQ